MLMRFHWGLAVGHVYTHQQPCTNGSVVWGNSGQNLQSSNGPEDLEVSNRTRMDEDIIGSGTDGSGSESDDDDYEPSEDEEDDDDDDDEHWLDTNEMYGSLDSDDNN